MKFVVLIRQDVGVGNEIVVLCPEFLLGLNKIEAEPVLARDFIAHRKMIYPLELIETLIEERLA